MNGCDVKSEWFTGLFLFKHEFKSEKNAMSLKLVLVKGVLGIVSKNCSFPEMV